MKSILYLAAITAILTILATSSFGPTEELGFTIAEKRGGHSVRPR